MPGTEQEAKVSKEREMSWERKVGDSNATHKRQ